VHQQFLSRPFCAQRLLPYDPAFDNRIENDSNTVVTVTAYEEVVKDGL